mmetsp:Transcript_26006/g.46065  ORF Transcript_26006/g.46065 Transcript_26006/m.46065 type:complete len:269 (-) Transcript_26006:3139-3945(-)
MWRLKGLRHFTSTEAGLSFKSYNLSQRFDVGRNCKVLRFDMPTPEESLDLPIGDHLVARLQGQDEKAEEDFTAYPISVKEDVGFFELMLPLLKPKTPYAERLSLLKVGQPVKFAKAKGSFNYLGQGNFEIRREERVFYKHVKYLGMITESAELAQMLALINTAAFDPNESLNISLLYSSRQVTDILFKDELEELYSNRLIHLDMLLESAPSDWLMSSGDLSKELLAETMPPIDTHSLILVSGRHSKKAKVLESLESLGYPANSIQVFD